MSDTVKDWLTMTNPLYTTYPLGLGVGWGLVGMGLACLGRADSAVRVGSVHELFPVVFLPMEFKLGRKSIRA